MRRDDYKPSRLELERAPCSWNVPLDRRQDCSVLGCPRHDPRNSWYWVRYAEAHELNTGLEYDVRLIGTRWRAECSDGTHYDFESETKASWFALGALKSSPEGGVKRVWHGRVLESAAFIEPEPDDGLYVPKYHQVIERRAKRAEASRRYRERKKARRVEAEALLRRPLPRTRPSALAG